MNTINENIKDFIIKNQVSTVCFVDNKNKPYCINCFYVFDDVNAILIFKSSYGTTHDAYVKQGLHTSGTILEDQIDVTKLKGIQFTGTLFDQQQMNDLKLHLLYVNKFPMSLAMPGYIWGVKLVYIKFTDNSFGFGNKTIWEK